MTKIGLFGGTFDPMHNTHLDIALTAKHQLGLDEVWILIDKNPRRKIKVSPYNKRLEIASLTCREYPFLIVDSLELQKQGVTHSIESLTKIMQEFPGHDFTLILGEDVMQHFETWKHAETFAKLTSFVIVKRPGSELNMNNIKARMRKTHRVELQYNFIDIKQSNVSSSKIRQDIKLQKEPDGLEPEVLALIKNSKLY